MFKISVAEEEVVLSIYCLIGYNKSNLQYFISPFHVLEVNGTHQIYFRDGELKLRTHVKTGFIFHESGSFILYLLF